MSNERTVPVKGMLAAFLGLVACCVRADALPAKVGEVMTVGCRIRVTAEGAAIRIDAVANSAAVASGSYRLEINKSSPSGASHNTQSGEFNLEANSEKILSTTFLGATDAGHFQAKLVIDSNSGSASCVSP